MATHQEGSKLTLSDWTEDKEGIRVLNDIYLEIRNVELNLHKILQRHTNYIITN
jgi:hypothetical protein